jgi:hypothetical protein
VRRIGDTSRGRRGVGALTLAVLLGVLLAAVTGNLGALAGPKTPVSKTPTITAGPSGAVSSTSATFSFSSNQSGVSFRCRLDSGVTSSCTSGITYTGLSQGAHTFRVTATAPGATESAAATRSWTVDTVAPPKPVVTKGPDDPSSNTNAGFDYTVADATASFQCQLDAGPFTNCAKNHTEYPKAGVGDHCFVVRAVDAAGNVSAQSTAWCWTATADDFPVSGSISGFYPGRSQRLDLSIGNPNNFDLRVLSVGITVQDATERPDGSASACIGSQNLVVTQALQVSPTPVVIPRNTTRTLSQLGIPEAQWPLLTMPNLEVNQDVCKNTVFTLTYSGTGTK